MQAIARDGLTADEVTALVEAAALDVDAGVELLDDADTFIEDISDDLEVDGSDVAHGNYQDVHTTCRLRLTRELAWGSQRLRPYITLTDPVTGASARFNLGVHLPDTPEEPAGETPATFTVTAFDKTVVLDQPIGETWRAVAGDGHLESAQALLTAAGESKVLVENLGDDKVLPSDRLWPIAEDNTFRRAINDLLSAVGYRSVWCDWDGWFRFERYVAPSQRSPEWVYDSDSSMTIVGEDRVRLTDLFHVPNRWVFINNDPAAGAPSEGAGMYTVDNVADGITSQNSRGRTITRIVRLDAADQTSLVEQGDKIALADRKPSSKLRFTTGPNPLHWHFDLFAVNDPDLDLGGSKFQSSSWRLPLNGGDMTHEAGAV